MNRIKNILWGLVFVIIGLIVGLNSFEITNINIFFDGFWTLFIIVPCFIGLFSDSDKTGNIIGFIIGLLLLLGCNDKIDFDVIWKAIAPIIFIVIGISIMFKNGCSKKVKDKMNSLSKKIKEDDEYFACFGMQNVNFADDKFTGAELTSIFGGIKCDFTNSKIDNDAVIIATSLFGVIDIIVPEGVRVKVRCTPIFGGVSNQRTSSGDEHTIYINAVCMFGGVNVK